MSPRRQLHHDNSCHDNTGRPAPQGRLVRSRSDETLTSFSVLPRRRPSALRRKKKTTAAGTDQLISDFNEGKEIDLDRLTAHTGVDSASFNNNSVPPNVKPTPSDVTSAHGNVRSWLETQNNVGGSSKWTAPGSKHHSLDIHHL